MEDGGSSTAAPDDGSAARGGGSHPAPEDALRLGAVPGMPLLRLVGGQRAHLTGRGLAGDEAIAESRFTDAIRFYSHALLPDESVDVGSLILVTSAMPVLRWQPRAG